MTNPHPRRLQPRGAARATGVISGLAMPGIDGLASIEDRDDGHRGVERVMGIEPTLAAWEAAVLPLNYTRYAGEF